MTELVLRGDLDIALTHMTLMGAAVILEDAGAESVSLRWSDEIPARPILAAPGLDWQLLGKVVGGHASRHAEDASWTAARIDLQGRSVGAMSPRLSPPRDRQAWQRLADGRQTVIDHQLAMRRWLDLRLIGALGEPAYWRRNGKGDQLPDEGASRWEMKTRNRGEEFVGDRLHRLAVWVGGLQPTLIAEGLAGEKTTDLDGKVVYDSRTATGLASPGPTDASAVWCGLWAISLFPVVPIVGRASETAGHLRRSGRTGRRGAWFYLPVARSAIGLPRLRSIIASESLAEAAGMGVDPHGGDGTLVLARRRDRDWLEARGIGQIMRFPIGEFGSASAPERRALAGEKIWSAAGDGRLALG